MAISGQGKYVPDDECRTWFRCRVYQVAGSGYGCVNVVYKVCVTYTS